MAQGPARPSSPVANPAPSPSVPDLRPSSPVANPAPSPSVAVQIADGATSHFHAISRAVRAATTTVQDVGVLAGSVYALGHALLKMCPWCKKGFKGLRKTVRPNFCPNCHRDLLARDNEMQKIWESQRKHIRAANKHERENREMHLIEKITEETKVRKARSRNRE